MCGQEDSWLIGPHVVDLPVQNPGPSFLPPFVYPVVLVMCGKCAFLRAHAAMAMDIVPKRAGTAAAEAESEPEAKHGA